MSVPQRPKPAADSSPVPELRRLLGAAVLLACPTKTKKPNGKWGHLTLADMTPEYLAKLNAGNIGVALGDVSGGLCAIDIDGDGLVEPFLDANPELVNTFQTHGSRGRVFWIRLKNRYLKTVKLKTAAGEPAGELRANGSQSIVWGVHPDTGQPYEWVVNKPAVEIEPGSIVWPDCFEKPTFYRAALTEDGDTENGLQSAPNRETFTDGGVTEQSLTEASDVILCARVASADCGGAGTIKNREDVLRLCVPQKVHQNNDLLFKLARGILNLEKLDGYPYSLAQRLDVFNEWFKRSRPFLRLGQSRDAYLAEFMNAKKRANTPLGGNTIDEAWNLAQSEPLPAEAAVFEEERNQRLVGFCFQLQRLNGDEPFFISSRVCQRLLGLGTAYEAAKWLTALQEMGVIELAEKGSERRATRYWYSSLKPSPPPVPKRKI
jgi:hypothetical protein